MGDDDELADTRSGDALRMTTDIVASFVANNKLSADELGDLIRSVHRTLSALSNGAAEKPAERPKPAAPVNKSVQHDYIICLEDGKKLKMLKRHLMTHYGMTPDDYRAKWGLPADYPMVAPAYAEQRRDLAKAIGLGRAPGSGRKKKAQ